MSHGIEICVEALSHRFGKREVLRDVSLTIEPGVSVAITGPSGSGKSTLLACLLGLIHPTSGRVTLAGRDISRLSRSDQAQFRADFIGVVFQRGELIPSLTAEENVLLPGLLGGSTPEHLGSAKGLLATLNVEPDTLARELSGGEIQRVALARALYGNPGLVLADEPTGALDAAMRDTAADRLFAECHARDTTLVVVTHDPAVAARADRVVHLSHEP